MAINLWGDYDYPCFTALRAGSTIVLRRVGPIQSVFFEISTDGIHWLDYTLGDVITLSNFGDSVYWRRKDTIVGLSKNDSKFYIFVMTGKIAGGGNISYLSNFGENTDYCYYGLFYNCTALTTAPDLPTTTLGARCYQYMFDGCTSLTTAPDLPATTLTEYCYYGMFHGCTSLASAPALPATTLETRCYQYMFYNCTALTTAPALPATTLADACYEDMFYNCTSLESLPLLPATTLPSNCYTSMFNGCSKIKLSETSGSGYTRAYRIPASGAGTGGGTNLSSMFANTGGAFTGTPTIDTTYYTSNSIVG